MDEITRLWRAIDILVTEVWAQPTTSQWFREEWERLVRERTDAAITNILRKRAEGGDGE